MRGYALSPKPRDNAPASTSMIYVLSFPNPNRESHENSLMVADMQYIVEGEGNAFETGDKLWLIGREEAVVGEAQLCRSVSQ
jgi:hypothetical protein